MTRAKRLFVPQGQISKELSHESWEEIRQMTNVDTDMIHKLDAALSTIRTAALASMEGTPFECESENVWRHVATYAVLRIINGTPDETRRSL